VNYLIIFLFLLCGCFQNKTQRDIFKAATKDKNQQQFQGDVKLEYPSPTSNNISASGNAIVNINTPNPETVLTKNIIGSLKNESSGSFSIDSYLKSVSLGGYIAILLIILLIIASILYVLKNTWVGKGLDKLGGSILSDLDEKLKHTNPNSETWNKINEIRNGIKGKIYE